MRRIPRTLAPLVLVTGPVYGTAVRLRNTLYDCSILRKLRLRSPVISVGNVTTGGTGKTPLVIHIAKKITEMGFTPAILSRGYGRPDPAVGRIVSPGESIEFPVRYMGDEPALIRRHVPEAWFGISKNRRAAGCMIERKAGKPVFILDDGFQHRKLHRDLDIVVIDSSQPLKKNRIFPRGTLREPVSGLRRSHAIVLNGTRESDTAGPAQITFEKLHCREKIFHCSQIIETLIPFDMWIGSNDPISDFPAPDSAFLTAALGNPERFHADVLKFGIRVCGTRFYSDHYSLRPEDWNRCVETARKDSADAIIVTEKDAIKIEEPPDFPLLVAVQATRFSDEKAFVELLHQGIDTSLQVEG